MAPLKKRANSQTTMLQHEDNESTPLLSSSQAQNDGVKKRQLFQTPQSIVLALLAVVILTSFGDMLEEAPIARIYEAVLCYEHYEEYDSSKIKIPRSELGPGAIGGVDELWCKQADPVQNDLAMLNGIQLFLDGFPCLLLAVPFGWLADRYGRKPFIMLNLIQFMARTCWAQFVAWQWQFFDVRALWAQSLFCVLGGGAPTASALFFCAISDVVPEKDRANAFLRLSAANLSASLFMPPLAALLMEKTPWIPSLVGAVLMALAVVLYLFVPETLNYAGHSGPAAADSALGPPEPAVSNLPISRNFLVRYTDRVRTTMAFLTRDYRVPLLILPFLTHILITGTGQLLLQYISKRYTLTFSSATLVITVRNAVQVALLFTILPFVSTFVMTKLGLSSQRKDLYLALISQILVTIGWLAVAASPNIPTVGISLAIASLGQGATTLIRSFLSSILPADEIARTYSVIAIVDTLGIMLGSPLLAELFKKDIGLPFWALGGSNAFFVVLLFAIPIRKGEESAITARHEATE
ncbi:putative major facilitator superfamily, MFS transporter superfamily [Septoria linicola]|nr:putative major facilitator superfamily, MFS transporter superfamily [Septoria linicola]